MRCQVDRPWLPMLNAAKLSPELKKTSPQIVDRAVAGDHFATSQVFRSWPIMPENLAMSMNAADASTAPRTQAGSKDYPLSTLEDESW